MGNRQAGITGRHEGVRLMSSVPEKSVLLAVVITLAISAVVQGQLAPPKLQAALIMKLLAFNTNLGA